MDFKLTPEQEMIKKAAKEFADREIEPIAAQVEREKNMPPDMLKKFAKARLLGMTVPREYGGVGSSFLNWALATEQISYPASACGGLMAMNNTVPNMIDRYGTQEQKEKYIRPLCQGEVIASLAFTEPATGADPRLITTTAELDGEYYRINGTKRFITDSPFDGPVILFAKTNDRISGFIVDKNSEGYTTSKPYELMGGGGWVTADIYLKEVRVPKDNLIGDLDNGFIILLQWAATSKLALCAGSVGLAQAALDESVRYAKERVLRNNRPIAATQSIQWMLAEMACKVEAARYLLYWAASLVDQGKDVMREAAIAKLFSSRAGVEVADMGLRVHGAYGFTTEYKIERIYRQAKGNEVIEGTSEVQRSIVAGFLVR
jgi:butyryl-CoA dehydrogenase